MVEDETQQEQPTLTDLLPKDLDWEELVRTYPIPAVLVAALGGFLLARTKGDWVVAALSSFATAQVTRHVNELLGDEVL